MPEGSELIGRPNDGEAVVQPIGMCQPHRCGLAFGFGALGRLRRTEALTSGWCRCRHIKSAHIRKRRATSHCLRTRLSSRQPSLFVEPYSRRPEFGFPARRAARRRSPRR